MVMGVEMIVITGLRRGHCGYRWSRLSLYTHHSCDVYIVLGYFAGEWPGEPLV